MKKISSQVSQASQASHGFTYTEIGIVVLIIGLLALIAIPAFLKARDNARLHELQQKLAADPTQLDHLTEIPMYRDAIRSRYDDIQEFKESYKAGTLKPTPHARHSNTRHQEIFDIINSDSNIIRAVVINGKTYILINGPKGFAID